MSRVSVKQTAPLVWSDPQASFGGDLDDLGVVFSSQCVVRSELFLQLHQRAVSVALCHLGFQSLFSFKIEVCVYPLGRVENSKTLQNQMSQCFFIGLYDIETWDEFYFFQKKILIGGNGF